MSERNRQPSPPPAEADLRSWDPAVIADALGVPADARLDLINSKGALLRIGQPPALDLELHPTIRIVRINAPDVSLSLVQEQPPRLAAHGVIFETPERTLLIAPSGETLLRIGPPKPPQTPPEPPVSAEQLMTQDAAADGLPDDLATPDEGPGPAAAMPRPEGKETQQERISVFGRLATPVRFRTLRNERLIGEFVLAERIDEEQTTFHKVTAFDNPDKQRQLATKLKTQVDAGEIGKGQPAAVVGYRHQVQRKKQGGETRTEEQIYAVSIKPR